MDKYVPNRIQTILSSWIQQTVHKNCSMKLLFAFAVVHTTKSAQELSVIAISPHSCA